ncbi:M23 family metallopeptidase [Kangiella aquimarina]|uniref:M23 family metallopeptidase n=1 Tax=Kangiella aquimarina TaxID=261965 RepID=A0ABZ0X2J3_9GAMM|nr:M23 family metallopeptidase [Kangiella aquimarina]WQG84596.1 M23 family metallopeptidase [Kangiella aquimarina]
MRSIVRGISRRLLTASCLFAASLCCTSLQAYQEESTEDELITKEEFVYSYDEMLNFDVEAYLQTNAPHLAGYAEIISHYAGYSSISPKVLIAIMEQQTGIISNPVSATTITRPFGDLSSKIGFKEQVQDISSRLAKEFYRGHSYSDTGSNEVMTTDEDVYRAIEAVIPEQAEEAFEINRERGTKGSSKKVSRTHRTLFEESKKEESTTQTQSLVIADINNYFQLPFRVGESWRNGGSHTNHGSGTYPQSSLDFNAGGYWGDNLSHIWVSASAPGVIKNHSSCFSEIIHDDGWSTTYYHIENIQYPTGSNLQRNTRIANYANDTTQALCNGGQSSGPHLHFSLKKDGQFYHLNGIKLSGYEVRTGRSSYDSNCGYFWLSRNGYKYCAWTNIYNYGIADSGTPEQGDIYSGYLSHHAYHIQPDGSWFYYYGGTISGELIGPGNADFDVRLERWNGYGWQRVAVSESPSSNESINYSANSGYYRMVVYSYSGSGRYQLTIIK